jgi:hypothetical protein
MPGTLDLGARGHDVRPLILMLATSVVLFVRWCVRIANGGKGYSRERRPRSVADYHMR